MGVANGDREKSGIEELDHEAQASTLLGFRMNPRESATETILILRSKIILSERSESKGEPLDKLGMILLCKIKREK